MRYSFDDEKLEVKLRLEEKDIADAFEIKKIMQMPGWKILNRYHEAGREQILDTQKKLVLDPAKSASVMLLAAILKGWDDRHILADLVVKRAEDFMERQNEEKETEKLGGGLL